MTMRIIIRIEDITQTGTKLTMWVNEVPIVGPGDIRISNEVLKRFITRMGTDNIIDKFDRPITLDALMKSIGMEY